jgi:hypothetical protein
MSEWRIDRVRLRVDNAAGHEHRLEPLARLAAALVAERLARGPASDEPAPPSGAARLRAPSVRVNLAVMSDRAAARRIASAWLAALLPAARGDRPSGRPGGRG